MHTPAKHRALAAAIRRNRIEKGLTEADVERIIKSRPYSKKHELLDRGVLDEKKFNEIRDEVEVAHPGK